MLDSDEHVRLHEQCTAAVQETFTADTAGLQATSHGFLKDLEVWAKHLTGRTEEDLFVAATREYQFALLAVVQGQYRQAFMALRLSFELLLAVLQLSAHELHSRMWLRGQRDIVWATLIDKENGVLSKTFIAAFYDELAYPGPQYRAMAETVYRECSEYVHDNAPTHLHLPATVKFSADVFEEWHSRTKVIRLVASFALAARYVRLCRAHELENLEHTVLDNLGHVEAIRALFGAPAESAAV